MGKICNSNLDEETMTVDCETQVQEALDNIAHEARILMQLNHPNIIRAKWKGPELAHHSLQ